VVPVVTAVVALVAAAAPAWALGDLNGNTIPNTQAGDPGAQLAAPPSVVQKLTLPFDGTPASGTGDTGSPEDDLAHALDALAAAPDAAAATAARTLALSILEGSPIPRKPYSGMPLLNWNAPAKVKTVPAGGDVVVNEVRFGDHVLSDTWLLDFADPNAPFTITYRVAETGVGFGGVFAPTLLLADGGRAVGGQPSVLQTLAPGELPAGTTTKNKFHPDGAAEHTRLGVQQLTVRMPPPRYVEAIVDPGVEPGTGPTSLLTLRRATPERIADAENTFGFSGATPTDAEKLAAIGRLGPAAPEKVLWTHLRALDPAAPGFLDAAHQLGANDRALVGAMRSRFQVPTGVQTDSGADVSLVLLNDEAYLSRRSVHLDSGASVTISVTNADGFTHGFGALELHDRKPAFGALDWGQFQWSPIGDSASIAPGASRTITLTPAATSFELWLGDPAGGDQAGLALRLDRGPRRQSLRFTPAWSHPNHAAVDDDGNLWVTLGGVDALAEVTPSADLAAATEKEFPLPGGDASFATGGKLDPHDVAVDGRGIVWATLADGNAIARLDPATAHAGSSDGIRVYPLDSCPQCKPAFPVEPGVVEPPSRVPEQMAVQQDADGNTVVWFTELEADAVGVLRVADDGSVLAQLDVPCSCSHPKGIALGDDGSVWFTEEAGNRIGRITIDDGPFEAAGMHIAHYAIPSAVRVAPPGLPEISTSSPHSVAVDELGRVWFSEEETSKLGFLDPARARPGTTDGMTELDLPNNEFREAISPADIAVDRSNTVFFADEYGDEVGSATAAGGVDQLWRPRARQSLTDKPVVDASGNLWFTETGANLLTRLSAVAAPALAPAPPPVFTADTVHGTVSAAGLRDVATVDVTVERQGAVVARAAAAPVAGGSFSVDVPVRGRDVVDVTPNGSFAHAPISFGVVDIDAAVDENGSVRGAIGAGGAPLMDAVRVDVAGRSAGARIGRDLGFESPAGLASAASSGTVTAAGATRAGVFRTVVGFGPHAAAPPPAPATPAPPAPAPVTAQPQPAQPAPASQPAAKHPATTVTELGRRALALVSYRWQRLGYRIVFAPARLGVRAETDTARRKITVYVRLTDSPVRIAHDIAHEVGHAYDARFFHARERHAYLVLRHRSGARWWPKRVASDYATGAGDFAEVFALCHSSSREFRSILAPKPVNACALLHRVDPRMERR
jgi:streptogramin lyase